jgi:hypothetical protein
LRRGGWANRPYKAFGATPKNHIPCSVVHIQVANYHPDCHSLHNLCIPKPICFEYIQKIKRKCAGKYKIIRLDQAGKHTRLLCALWALANTSCVGPLRMLAVKTQDQAACDYASFSPTLDAPANDKGARFLLIPGVVKLFKLYPNL